MAVSQFSFEYISVCMIARVIILVSNYMFFGVKEYNGDILKAKAKYV